MPAKDITAVARLPGDGRLAFDNDGKNNRRIRAGTHWRKELVSGISIFAGYEWEERSTENYRFRYDDNGNPDNLSLIGLVPQEDGSVLLIPEGENQEDALFAELSIKLNNMEFRVGNRFINHSDYGAENAPSANFVYQWDSNQSLKLVYNVGFNSPTFLQSSSTDQLGRPIDIDVEPELIESSDVAYTYSGLRTLFVVNAFYVTANQLIISQGGGFENTKELQRSGVELDFQYRENAWTVMASAAYLDQGDSVIAGDPGAKFTPKFLIKAGAFYEVGRHIIGASIRSVSRRAQVDNYQWVNASYRFVFSQGEAYVSIGNLFQQDITHPDVGSNLPAKIQATPKDDVSIGLTVTF